MPAFSHRFQNKKETSRSTKDTQEREISAQNTPLIRASRVTLKNSVSKWQLMNAQRGHSGHPSMRHCGTRARFGTPSVNAVSGAKRASYKGRFACGSPWCVHCSHYRQDKASDEIARVLMNKDVKAAYFVTLTLKKTGTIKETQRALSNLYARWFKAVKRKGEIWNGEDFKISFIRSFDITANPYETNGSKTHIHIHSILILNKEWDFEEFGKGKWRRFARKLGFEASERAQDIVPIRMSGMDARRAGRYLHKDLSSELNSKNKISKTVNATGLGGLLNRIIQGCEQSKALYRLITGELRGAKATTRGKIWRNLAGIEEEKEEEVNQEDFEEKTLPASVILTICPVVFRVLVKRFGEFGETYPLILAQGFADNERKWVEEFCQFQRLVCPSIIKSEREAEEMLYSFFSATGRCMRNAYSAIAA